MRLGADYLCLAVSKCSGSSPCHYSGQRFLPLPILRAALSNFCSQHIFHLLSALHAWAVGRPSLCWLEGSDQLLLSACWAWLLYVQPQGYSPVNLTPDPRGRKPGYVVRVLNTYFHLMWDVLCVQRNTRKGSDLHAIKNPWERGLSLGAPLGCLSTGSRVL